jgi:hypothetical protein
VRVDARLREEAERLRFRFACEDCAHFAPDRDACSLGYLASPRRAELDAGAPRAVHASLELCKTFELA